MNWQDPVQHAPSGGNPVSPPKVTIRDVARESGLSVASVSRALSGSRPVTPAVARVVDDVASRLGYRPDHVAQSLSTGRTATVGLVLPDISSPFFPALAGAIEKTLRMSGLTMLLMSTENDPEWERKCVADLVARRIDGLLISPSHRFRSRPTIDDAMGRIPVVQVDRYASARAHRVVTDAMATVQLVLQHMSQQGYRRFAFVGAKSSASSAWARSRAYRRLIPSIDPQGAERMVIGEFTVDFGRRSAEYVFAHWPDVDAVVCANDLIALGFIQAAIELGREAPGDIGVSGCDDTFFSTVSHPTITSVVQPVWDIARKAIELLVGGEQTNGPAVVEFMPELRVRTSTDRCRNQPAG
jgi:LacI family transcriptional regulator